MNRPARACASALAAALAAGHVFLFECNAVAAAMGALCAAFALALAASLVPPRAPGGARRGPGAALAVSYAAYLAMVMPQLLLLEAAKSGEPPGPAARADRSLAFVAVAAAFVALGAYTVCAFFTGPGPVVEAGADAGV